MRPNNLKTKIFLDSGDPKETEEALSLLGFLDGQTTNPSLISKIPEIVETIEKGKKLGREEFFDFYQGIAREISRLIPGGSVSLEVYADEKTKAKEMAEEAKKLFAWIPNAHIKLPIIPQGLMAAQKVLAEGLRVNMTLCFSQEQAAAVYSATRAQRRGEMNESSATAKGLKKSQTFLSPFVGRLDDRGENGMELVKNIIKMYREIDSQVEVVTASVRSLEHLLTAIELGSDIVTAPLRVLKEWKAKDFILPAEDFKYEPGDLKPVPYKNLNLDLSWQEFNLYHHLTETGLKAFAKDWRSIAQ